MQTTNRQMIAILENHVGDVFVPIVTNFGTSTPSVRVNSYDMVVVLDEYEPDQPCMYTYEYESSNLVLKLDDSKWDHQVVSIER